MNKIEQLRAKVDELLKDFSEPVKRSAPEYVGRRVSITEEALRAISKHQGFAPQWARELLRLYE